MVQVLQAFLVAVLVLALLVGAAECWYRHYINELGSRSIKHNLITLITPGLTSRLNSAVPSDSASIMTPKV
jgi:hypothetical protein